MLQGSPAKAAGRTASHSVSASNLADVDGAVAIMERTPARRRLVPLPPERKALFVHVRLNRVHCRVTYQVEMPTLLCQQDSHRVDLVWILPKLSCESLSLEVCRSILHGPFPFILA